MAIVEVTDAEFREVVLRSAQPVLVDYWAEWCTPCKQLAPILDELAEAYGDRMQFVKLDTSHNQVTPTRYAVNGLPTIHIFVGGELVKCFQGAKSKSTLTKAIEAHL